MIDITDNIKQVIGKLKQLPGKVEKAGRRTLAGASVELARIMRRPGLRVTYPINWDSLIQKIYVILKLKREGNLPYQRKGDYENAWQASAISNGYMVANIGHNAMFLSGVPSDIPIVGKVTPTGQSHIHEGRWRLVRPALLAILRKLPSDLLNEIRIEANK